MAAFGDNPFAILTAIVAPAMLTNASSVLSLGTGNRMARVVERARVLSAALAASQPGSPPYDFFVQQLEKQHVRGQLLMKALRFVYSSLGLFAASALIAVVGSGLQTFDLQMSARVVAGLGLSIGTAGVGALVTACVFMVRETQFAVLSMTEEAEFAKSGGRG